jgi:hypothetical protein
MLNNPNGNPMLQMVMNSLGIKSPNDAFNALKNLSSGDLNKLGENFSVMGLTPIEIQIFADEIIKRKSLEQVCSARNMTPNEVMAVSQSAKKKLEDKMMEQLGNANLFQNLFSGGNK